MTTMAHSFTTHLTSSVVHRVRTRLTEIRSEPVPRTHLTYLITLVCSHQMSIKDAYDQQDRNLSDLWTAIDKLGLLDDSMVRFARNTRICESF